MSKLGYSTTYDEPRSEQNRYVPSPFTNIIQGFLGKIITYRIFQPTRILVRASTRNQFALCNSYRCIQTVTEPSYCRNADVRSSDLKIALLFLQLTAASRFHSAFAGVFCTASGMCVDSLRMTCLSVNPDDKHKMLLLRRIYCSSELHYQLHEKSKFYGYSIPSDRNPSVAPPLPPCHLPEATRVRCNI